MCKCASMPALFLSSERSEDKSIMPCQAASTILQLLLVALGIEEMGSCLQLTKAEPEMGCAKHSAWICNILEINLGSSLGWLCALAPICWNFVCLKLATVGMNFFFFFLNPHWKIYKLPQVFLISIIMQSMFYRFFSWHLQGLANTALFFHSWGKASLADVLA